MLKQFAPAGLWVGEDVEGIGFAIPADLALE